jgi:predicted nucleotide-binding protein
MASIPQPLKAAIKKKLGNVSDRHVNRLIANVADDQLVSRRAAAMLLARKLKISFNKFATAEDLSEMRGHAVSTATIADEPAEPSPPPSKGASVIPTVKPAKNNMLFVVHGRDTKLNESMFAFLRAIGLNPMEWSQAIAATKGANPNIGAVINNAMKKVQGVLVMFSPDEQAKLKSKFCAPKEKNTLGKLGAQARPNVIFEAGLALGAHPKKTILVQIGDTRDISDIAGMHIPRLSDSSTSRKELAQRLKKMGFKVNMEGTSWMTEGKFDR